MRWLGPLVLGFLLSALANDIAHSHEWYSATHNETTGSRCCDAASDCLPLTYEQFAETTTDYVMIVDAVMADFLNVQPGRYSIPKAQAQPAQGSKPGETGYHGCLWGGQLQCFFFPSGS